MNSVNSKHDSNYDSILSSGLESSRESSRDELASLIASVLDVEASRIQPATVRSEIDEWDSLAQLGLVAALEETYNFTMTSAQMKQCDSVPEIVLILAAHQILV